MSNGRITNHDELAYLYVPSHHLSRETEKMENFGQKDQSQG
jgi:hypothetical protein